MYSLTTKKFGLLLLGVLMLAASWNAGGEMVELRGWGKLGRYFYMRVDASVIPR
jgi:hypothetical protein